jgi:hypothetical protein
VNDLENGHDPVHEDIAASHVRQFVQQNEMKFTRVKDG